MEIQVVAVPQNTLLSFPDGPQLLERALEMGADVVGGILLVPGKQRRTRHRCPR
jgi:hypothetical protein